MDQVLDTTRGLGDALALRRRFRDGTGVGTIRIPIRGLENSLHYSLFRQFCLILVSEAKPEVGTTIFTSPPKAEKEK